MAGNYDGVCKSYAEGKIDKKTLREFLWTMGASNTEIYYFTEAAENMKRANNASTRTSGDAPASEKDKPL